MVSKKNNEPKEVDKLVRIAILCTMAGMLLVLIFLLFGFRSWSVGIGVFLGIPVLVLGVALYLVAVFRDLKFRKVLDKNENDRD